VAVVESLKVLDPKWPIREADIVSLATHGRFAPIVLKNSPVEAQVVR
jgi:hypothetical protein